MSAADLGLTRKEIFEARETRDLEEASPGIHGAVARELAESGVELTKTVWSTVERLWKGQKAAEARKTRDSSIFPQNYRLLSSLLLYLSLSLPIYTTLLFSLS